MKSKFALNTMKKMKAHVLPKGNRVASYKKIKKALLA